MKKLWLDFETGCDLELKKTGRMSYVKHPSCYVQLMSVAVDDGPVQTFTCHESRTLKSILADFLPARIYAFNAQFEYAIINHVLGLRVPLTSFVDVMAICARYGLPQSLAGAGAICCPDVTKDGAGTKLVNMFKHAKPFDCTGNMWEEYKRYNAQDVESMRALVAHLPADDLDEREAKIWALNAAINERGLPVAVDEAKLINDTLTTYLAHANERVAELTQGEVTTTNQNQRIVSYINRVMGRDYLADLTAKSVEDALEESDALPPVVVDLLTLRNAAGSSSVKKYKKILDMQYAGRIYDNSRYYGAHTGRITGEGFQLLNLPRADVDDVEAEIEKFRTGAIMQENPVKSARALLRSMIKAPDGQFICCADYKSIEYIILVWLAQDWDAVKRFDEGFDPYIDLATTLFRVQYEDVTKPQRQNGKVGILGGGYQMGAAKLVEYAKAMHIPLTLAQSKDVISAYRKKYHRVVTLWSAFMNAALTALRHPQESLTVYNTAFSYRKDRAGAWWLCVTLPSQRTLFYRSPAVETGEYGDTFSFYGVLQTSKRYVKKWQTPGKLTENIVQALGRDILYAGKHHLCDAGFSIIGSIYDENICCEPFTYEPEARLNEMMRLMCIPPAWAAGMPLKADGWTGPRYKKA
jgi:DNA polymerase